MLAAVLVYVCAGVCVAGAPPPPAPAPAPIPLDHLHTLGLAMNSTRHLPPPAPHTNTTYITEGGRVQASVIGSAPAPALAAPPSAPPSTSKKTSMEPELVAVDTTKSHIKPRKEAKIVPEAINTSKSIQLTDKTNATTTMISSQPTISNSSIAVSENPIQNNSSKVVIKKPAKGVFVNTTVKATSVLPPTHNISTLSPTASPAPKKPLILFSMDDDDSSSAKAQLRTPKQASVTAHPNLVIPVTITVFALPLFALLGYYALKHGREAWKNRHYRRMDFLLDGMYND